MFSRILCVSLVVGTDEGFKGRLPARLAHAEKPTQVYAAALANVAIAFRSSKDPSVFMVLAEDSAARGLAVAGAGIWLEQVFHTPLPDAIASILIGVILCVVAVMMGFGTKALLLGESADKETVQEILRIVSRDPIVAHAHPPLTMHFAPDEILLNLVVEFKGNVSGDAIVESIASKSEIRQRFPHIRRIFVFSLGHGYEGTAGVITVGMMGLIFGLIYSWRGSLVAPIVMHFLQDFAGIVLLPFMKTR